MRSAGWRGRQHWSISVGQRPSERLIKVPGTAGVTRSRMTPRSSLGPGCCEVSDSAAKFIGYTGHAIAIADPAIELSTRLAPAAPPVSMKQLA